MDEQQYNDPEILELIDRLDLIDEEIARLIIRNDSYIELKSSIKNKVLNKLRVLSDKCTHKLPDGSYATHFGMQEKWVQSGNAMRKQAVCVLCNSVFVTNEIKDIEESVAKKIAEDKFLVDEWRELAPNVEYTVPEEELPTLEFNPAINVFENPNLANKVRLLRNQH